MNEQIINQLKQLYELEKFQVNYYTSQLSSAEDSTFNNALTKIIKTEKAHIAYFTKMFIESSIDISNIASTIANITGSLVGESMELTGTENICKIGVALEKRALNIYSDLIEESLNSKLLDQLIDFKIDKEFHALWLQYYAQYLKQKLTQNNSIVVDSIEDHPTINLNMRLI